MKEEMLSQTDVLIILHAHTFLLIFFPQERGLSGWYGQL